MRNAEDVTVAEIAADSLAAVRVFEKYGIDYCCGGKRPLAEVCREKGHDPVHARIMTVSRTASISLRRGS